MPHYITGVHTLEPEDYDYLLRHVGLSGYTHPLTDDEDRVMILEISDSGDNYVFGWWITGIEGNEVYDGIKAAKEQGYNRITARKFLAELRST